MNKHIITHPLTASFINGQLNFCKLESERFLTTLSGKPNGHFTFQTFDDVKERHNGTLVRVLHGTLDQHYETLCRLNRNGAGIFVTVNETDLKGRKRENIIALRSLFVDDDEGNLRQLKITASIITRAKRGIHAYWLLRPGEELNQFENAQNSLIGHLGTDDAVHDLSRVMRLPGFYHLKDPEHPFLIKIENINSNRYRISEVMNVYPPSQATPTNTPLKDNKHPNPSRSVVEWRKQFNETANEGHRHFTLSSLAGHLLRKYVDPYIALELLISWNKTHCNPPQTDDQVTGIVDGIARLELTRRKGVRSFQ